MASSRRATLREKARIIRREVLRLTDICGSGHYGSAFSIAGGGVTRRVRDDLARA